MLYGEAGEHEVHEIGDSDDVEGGAEDGDVGEESGTGILEEHDDEVDDGGADQEVLQG